MTMASYQVEQPLHTTEYETRPTPQQDFLLLMPYDLIATIFSLLPTRELVTCTVVCQRWRSFVIDNPHILWRQLLLGNTMQFFKCPAFAGGPADWKTRHIRSFSMDHSRICIPYASIRESDMAAMFKRLIDTGCRYLEHMEFYDCPLSIVEFLQYTQFCGVNLRSLNISNSYIDPRIISIILSTCPNLISIDCHDCTPYVSSVLSVYPAVFEIPVCRLVSMQIIVDETTGPGYLAKLLRSCPNLRSLTLNSQVDWIVRDVIDRPPPEIMFDAIYDIVQQTCTKLESFTFSCLPYWTVSEHAFITKTSPASLQDLALLIAANNDDTPKYDIAEDNVVKRCYATLEYYVGCPPPRMKNAAWTTLSISVDTDIARVGYRFFPFTLGSVHKFLTDRPFLTTVELSGVSHKYNYKPSGRLIPAVTGLPLLNHLVLTNSDMQTVTSILGKHTCRTLKKLTVKNALWMGDRCWLEDLSKGYFPTKIRVCWRRYVWYDWNYNTSSNRHGISFRRLARQNIGF
ncbi:hypothetical protein BJV82DRAFT_160410 [Fennellomyces sp. T-0311]|nr:hypothetical protein BJV82DRAFT_160410 [Fennellomyces sp. T-0311]